MRIRIAMLGVLVALVFAAVAGAEQATPTTEAASASQPIQIAHTFLVSWGHERWDELKTVAGDEVTIRVADKVYSLKPGAETASEVKLMFPFRGLSTVRANGEVKGIAIQDLVLKVGDSEVRGSGTLTLQEQGGELRVVGVSSGK